MNVLSLFDGMSCGHQALDRAGIKVDNYFASEIDKYAIQVTMANYPNTNQLGSVVNVDGYALPKIDLLIGGSPCQSFSFAGKRKGMSTKDEQEILTLEHYLELKADGYEFEGQSYLFWEFMRLLYEVKPKYFLLENVEMGEKWEKVLTKAIGVNALHINSALVSAQNRKRIYFTNIGMESAGLFGYPVSIIKQPKDKKILLKDILESEVDEKYFLSEKMLNYFDNRKDNFNGGKINIRDENKKASAILKSSASIDISDNFIVHNTMPRSSTTGKGGTGHLSRSDGKTYCLDTGNTNAVEIVAMRGRPNEDGVNEQQLEVNSTGKSNSLTSVQKDNLVRGIIQHIIPEIVSVRKYDVNIPALQKCLKQHKKINNQQIADALNIPKTMVEHWFRTDTYFSIPDKDIWIKLKEILKINTNEFDESIMIFEEKESVFEKTNRVYDENGIAPTLTSTTADERILVREVKQLSTNNKSNGGTQPYQQDRIYDVNGISPALSAGKSDLMITRNAMEVIGCDYRFDEGFRFRENGKSISLPARGRVEGKDFSGQALAKINSRIRRLTPIECERLQTVKDNYTNYVSDSQRYKMLGNGWTIDVIAHIFSYIK